MSDMQGIVQNIVISRDKSIYVPEIIKKSIVQRDHNVDRLTFDCPRYWNGIDISKLNIYVNYIAAGQKKQGKEPESFLCENVIVDEDNTDIFHFDWRITSNVSGFPDKLIFLVCAKSVDAEGNEDVHWNSRLCTSLEVQEGLEASDSIVKKYPDVIESILSKLGKQIELRNSGIAIQYRNAGENIWTDLVQLEDIKGDAAVIIESNFKGSDTTANIMGKAGEAGDKWYSTDEGVYYMLSTSGEWINCGTGENLKKIEDEISKLKGDLSHLSEEMEQLKQGGTGTENVESRLKGHTMGVIGDSLSDRSRGVTQWFDWIASRAGGMNLSLDCVSGRRLMQFPSDGLSNQCDIICVFGGTNDFNSAQELGTLDTANADGKTTFYGAVYTLATELMTNYPKSVIIFITPLSSAPAYNSAENYKWYEYPSMGGHSVKDFCDAIKEVCCYLHIPVVDLFENSGLNYNYDTDNIYFVSDKLHLTDAGQEAISYVIEAKILEHYIPDNANATEIVTLSSISAEFTQGDSLYYPSSSLSDLKENLVVSAYYRDGTSNVITDYSLSGTLTEGTSTITVNYLGKTATFEVTVLAEGASEPFIATLTPDTTLGGGFYYENDFETLATVSPSGGYINCIYSEPVSIAGYNKIENDPDNVTYNWMKIAKVEEDGTIIGGCLIVYYDKDMNAISGEVNYNQYTTPSSNTYIATGLALKNKGTIPDEAVYFRALLQSSSTTTNTLKIS